jgi:hypothetical protein
MMNHNRPALFTIACAASAGVLLSIGGCVKEVDQEVTAAQTYTPPPPPPPPAPVVMSVADLMNEMRIDDRVHLLESRAPETTEGRRAVLAFFDAFARGNARALEEMLTEADRRELRAMVNDGTWQTAVDGITRIEIETGRGPDGECALALIESRGGVPAQAQLWLYMSESSAYFGSSDRFTFEAVPTPPGIVNRLSGGDWIAAWYQILERERELADRPDQPINMPSQQSESDDAGGAGGPSRGPGSDEPSTPRRRMPGPRGI